MKLPQRITAEWLIENGACDVDGFRKLFPTGATVTVANMQKALDADLDVLWLATKLPRPARAEYDKATAPALVKVWDEWSKE